MKMIEVADKSGISGYLNIEKAVFIIWDKNIEQWVIEVEGGDIVHLVHDIDLEHFNIQIRIPE